MKITGSPYIPQSNNRQEGRHLHATSKQTPEQLEAQRAQSQATQAGHYIRQGLKIAMVVGGAVGLSLGLGAVLRWWGGNSSRHSDLKLNASDQQEANTALTVREPTLRITLAAEREQLGLQTKFVDPIAKAENSARRIRRNENIQVVVPIGDEFRVNRVTTSFQTDSRIIPLSNNRFIVCWESVSQDAQGNEGVYGQVFALQDKSTPIKIGNEFLVNTFVQGSQRNPDIAALSEEQFVVVWGSITQVHQDKGIDIFSQVFTFESDSTPAKLGNEFLVNTFTNGVQRHPQVVALSEKRFLVCWEDIPKEGNVGTYGQIFDIGNNGTSIKLGGEFRINTYVNDRQEEPSIAPLSQSRFVASWGSEGQDGHQSGVYAQVFEAQNSGIPIKIGNEFRVNTVTSGNQERSSVTMIDEKNIVIVWQSDSQNNSNWGIYGQQFELQTDDSPIKIGNEFQIHSNATNQQENPIIKSLTNNFFIVVWDSSNNNGTDYGIRGQLFKTQLLSTPLKIGPEFVVNTYTHDDQRFPHLAILDQDTFSVTWSSFGQDGSGWGVYSQLFQISNQPKLAHPIPPQTIAFGMSQTINLADVFTHLGNETLTYSAALSTHSVLPVGIVLDKNSKTININYTDITIAGIYTVKLTATNHLGLSANTEFVIQLLPKAPVLPPEIRSIGHEFWVNSNLDFQQRESSILSLDNGYFIVTWEEAEDSTDRHTDLNGQLFKSNGKTPIKINSPFQIHNQKVASQKHTALANLGDGLFLAMWYRYAFDVTSTYLQGQIFELKNETVLRVGSELTLSDLGNFAPQITALENGLFAMFWKGNQHPHSDGSLFQLKCRLFHQTDRQLVFQGNEFKVDDYFVGSRGDGTSVDSSNLIPLNHQQFLVTWWSRGDDVETYDQQTGNVYGKIYSYASDQQPKNVTERFILHSNTTGDQRENYITPLVNDLFLVVFAETSPPNGGDGYDISAQLHRYRDGVPTRVGDKFFVARTAGNENPGIPVLLGSNQIIIVWNDQSRGIYGKLYELKDNEVVEKTNEFRIQTLDEKSDYISATSIGNGQIAISWALELNNNLDVRGRVLQQNLPPQLNSIVTTQNIYFNKTQSIDFSNVFTDPENQTLTYSATLSNGSDLPNWITLNQQEKTLTITNKNAQNIGRYSVKLTATDDSELSTNTVFDVVIVPPAPVLPGFIEPIGDEFRVNRVTSQAQQNPNVATLTNQRFVMIWQSTGQDGHGPGVFGRIYEFQRNNALTKVSAEFLVNTYTTGTQRNPRVSVLNEKRFIVVWGSNQIKDGQMDVFGQIFELQDYADENTVPKKIGKEFLINTHTQSTQRFPIITALSDNRFVVCWEDWIQEGNAGIYGQMFDILNNGTWVKVGHVFGINTAIEDWQWDFDIAALNENRFTVTWVSNEQDSSGSGIYAQMFENQVTSAPVRIGNEFPVATTTNGDQKDPVITNINEKYFIIVWQSNQVNRTSSGIYAQIFTPQKDETPAKIGNEFQVNSIDIRYKEFHEISDLSPVVKVLNDNYFLIAWNNVVQDDYNVIGQLFGIRDNGTTVTLGTEFRINNYTENKQIKPSVAILNEQLFTAVWSSFGQDGDNWGIYGRMFQVTNIMKVATPIPQQNIHFNKTQSIDFSNVFTVPKNQTLTYSATLSNGSALPSWITLNQQEKTLTITNKNAQNIGRYSVKLTSTDDSGLSTNTVFDVVIVPPAPVLPDFIERIGDEFQISQFSDSTDQEQPAAIMVSNNTFLVAWHRFLDNGINGKDIFARAGKIDASNNVVLGNEFRSNSHIRNWQDNPQIARLSDTSAIIVWESNHQDSSLDGVYAQVFKISDDLISSKIGDEFLINTKTINNQRQPRVVTISTSHFLIVWEDSNTDGSRINGFGQLFRFSVDHTPQKIGMEFQIDNNTTDIASEYDMTVLNTNECVISWSAGPHGSTGSRDIYAQYFQIRGDATPQKVGSEFLIHTETIDKQSNSKVTALSDHSFIVTWVDRIRDKNSEGIFAQQFKIENDFLITKNGPEFQVNTFTNGTQSIPKCIAIDDQNFITMWTSENQDSSSFGIYGQLFMSQLDKAPIKVGHEFQVNTWVDGKQVLRSLSHWQDHIIAVWESERSDTSNVWNAQTTNHVFSQLFKIDSPPKQSQKISQQTIYFNKTQAIDLSNVFTDPENQTLTYSATLSDGTPSPDWITLNQASNTLTISNNDAQNAGRYTITLTATNNVSLSKSTEFDIVAVPPAPVLPNGISRIGNEVLVDTTGVNDDGIRLSIQAMPNNRYLLVYSASRQGGSDIGTSNVYGRWLTIKNSALEADGDIFEILDHQTDTLDINGDRFVGSVAISNSRLLVATPDTHLFDIQGQSLTATATGPAFLGYLSNDRLVGFEFESESNTFALQLYHVTDDNRFEKIGSLFTLDDGVFYSHPHPPAIVELTEHRFAVVYETIKNGIKFRAFDLSSETPEAIGDTISLSAMTENGDNKQYMPSIAVVSDNRFIVTWAEGTSEALGVVNVGQLYGQLFSSDSATPETVDDVFQINTQTIMQLHESAVVHPWGNGKFVVVWNSINPSDSFGNIYGQLFDFSKETPSKISDNFQINTFNSGYTNWIPSITVDNKDRLIVSWFVHSSQQNTDYNEDPEDLLLSQAFELDESVLPQPTTIPVPTTKLVTSNPVKEIANFVIGKGDSTKQTQPAITILPNGDIATAWQNVENNKYTVVTGLFNTQGNLLDFEKSLLSSSKNINRNRTHPAVTAFDDGYYVGWKEQYLDSNQEDMYVSVFNSDGIFVKNAIIRHGSTQRENNLAFIPQTSNPKRILAAWGLTILSAKTIPTIDNGPEYTITTLFSGDFSNPGILPINRVDRELYLVSWQSISENSRKIEGIFIEFTETGLRRASQNLQLSSTSDPQNPVLLALADGEFCMIYQNRFEDSASWDIQFQRFDRLGKAMYDGNKRVNREALNHQQNPAAAKISNDRIMVVWEEYFPEDNKWGLIGQAIDESGNRIGDNFLLDSSHSEQNSPQIASNGNNTFAVAWAGKMAQDEDNSIYVKTYSFLESVLVPTIMKTPTTTAPQSTLAASKLPTDSPGSTSSSTNHTGPIIGGILGGVATIGAAVIVVRRLCSKKKTDRQNEDQQLTTIMNPVLPPRPRQPTPTNSPQQTRNRLDNNSASNRSHVTTPEDDYETILESQNSTSDKTATAPEDNYGSGILKFKNNTEDSNV